MNSRLKLLLVTLPLVLAGAGFVAYTIATKPPPAQLETTERATAVRVIRAATTAFVPSVSGFGLVAPARTYQAIPQVTGTAEYVNPLLKKGDILPAGALLVRLSASDFNLAIAQARANIRAAEARLAEIEVSQSNLNAALEIENEALTLKARDLERVERLFAAGTASQAARDTARAAYLAQRQKVQNLQNSVALVPTQRRVQTEQIALYKAALKTAELNLARTELRLPFAARVASVTVEVGQLVRSGVAIAEFDGIAAAEVEAQIPARDMLGLLRGEGRESGAILLDPAAISQVLDDLELQANVRLQLGGTTIRWPATVDRISNTIEPRTGTVGVIVRVENAYTGAELGRRPPLTKGMFVEVTLAAKPLRGILIPRSALWSGRVLLADDGDRLEMRPVTTRLVQGEFALIGDGIARDERIVVSTPVPMIEGMLLTPHLDSELMGVLAGAGSGR